MPDRKLEQAAVRRDSQGHGVRGSFSTCGVRFDFGTHRRPPFLVTDSLMEDLPDQAAEPMCDGPDCFLVFQARLEAAKHDFEYASFHFYRRVRRLIQNAAQVTVSFRRASALGDLRALFVSRTHTNP